METILKEDIRYRRDLWKLFKHIHPDALGPAVEVGVAEGNFSEEILNFPIVFPKVFMVDRWATASRVRGDSASPQAWHDANRDRVIARTKKFGERAVVMQMESSVAAGWVHDGSLSLVYVDGDHSYEGCSADIISWVPKLKPGGFIAFHDFENKAYGVNRAVTEYCKFNKKAIFHLPEDKPEDAGAYFQC